MTAGNADAAAISDLFQKGNPKFRKSIGPPIITAKSGRCINDLCIYIFDGFYQFAACRVRKTKKGDIRLSDFLGPGRKGFSLLFRNCKEFNIFPFHDPIFQTKSCGSLGTINKYLDHTLFLPLIDSFFGEDRRFSRSSLLFHYIIFSLINRFLLGRNCEDSRNRRNKMDL